jgi:hypothetical protein
VIISASAIIRRDCNIDPVSCAMHSKYRERL